MQKIILSVLALALSATFSLAAEPDAMAKDANTTSMQATPPPGTTSGDAMMSNDKMDAHDSMKPDDKMTKDDNKTSK